MSSHPNHTREQNLKMISIAEKSSTQRRAIAQGMISMGEAAFTHVINGTLPKGDPFSMAEVAGILAAKSAPRSIPLCHPILLDSVKVSFEKIRNQHSIYVFCEAEATGKTGVEMEALAGVTGAILALYDVIKAVDPALSISGIRLKRKEGGKHGDWRHPEEGSATQTPECKSIKLPFHTLRGAVLTVSDRAKAGVYEDRSGPLLIDWMISKGATLKECECVSDHYDDIKEAIVSRVSNAEIDLLLITGGTGLGPRDQTPDVIYSLAQLYSLKVIPGVGEALRATGAKFIPTAWLSRSVGAVVNNTLIIALPGSPKALREAQPILESLIPHALHTIKRGGHP